LTGGSKIWNVGTGQTTFGLEPMGSSQFERLTKPVLAGSRSMSREELC
jgi:hypothetical protein